MKGTLASKRDIERLFASGLAGKTHILTVVAREVGTDADQSGRVMIIAGRSIGGAVRRNRAKRVLREAARRARAPWAGYHVAIIAKPGVAHATPVQIDDALARALAQAGVRR